MTVSVHDLIAVFARIGILSFGGPAGQIALLHKEVVEQRKWLDEGEFLRALNFCMLLPGPEAMQLATYCGWKCHGQKGGLLAGGLFVLPGSLLMLVLSGLYAMFGSLPLIQSLFWGIKAAVAAIVLEALVKIARKALKRPLDWAIALAAFVALFVFAVPFLLVMLAAALFGLVAGAGEATFPTSERPMLADTTRTVAIWLVLWLAPLALLHATLGSDHLYTTLANMFSTLAVVTFGGAYAVLASLGQTVVEQAGWMTPQQMMDGFALAETTPGPLILVGQFVSFLSAQNTLGGLWPGVAASAIFLWMTFIPCFLWIFAFAPWIGWLNGNARLRGSLAAVTAAATGVILNLSLWFALHVVFGKVERLPGALPVWWPDLATFDAPALFLSVFLAITLLVWKAGIPKTLAFGLLAGLFWAQFQNLV